MNLGQTKDVAILYTTINTLIKNFVWSSWHAVTCQITVDVFGTDECHLPRLVVDMRSLGRPCHTLQFRQGGIDGRED